MNKLKVTPIPGERMVYLVDSATPGHEPYRVSLLENKGVGHCSCTSWGCRNWPKIKTGERSYCKHVLMCREQLLDDILKTLSETNL